MEPLVIALILLSAFIHAFWNFLAKRSANKFAYAWLMKVFESLIYLPLGVYLFVNTKISNSGLSCIVVSGIIHLLYWVFLFSSYGYGALSTVYLIARSSPVLVTIFAVIFLKERLTLIGILGIISVMLGIYLLLMESPTMEVLTRPFAHLRGRATLFAFLTALTVTAYSLVDKIGAQYVHPILYVWLFETLSLLLFTPLVIFSKDKREQIKIEWDNNKWAAAFSGFFVLFSYSLVIFVMRISQVSYIVSVREMSVIFVVILGGGFLKEKNFKTKLFSSVLIFIGILLIGIT
jgi:uncharacterized membrane protein